MWCSLCLGKQSTSHELELPGDARSLCSKSCCIREGFAVVGLPIAPALHPTGAPGQDGSTPPAAPVSAVVSPLPVPGAELRSPGPPSPATPACHSAPLPPLSHTLCCFCPEVTKLPVIPLCQFFPNTGVMLSNLYLPAASSAAVPLRLHCVPTYLSPATLDY